jgi:hypothetical protein
MARRKRASDTAYNARRRFIRTASRYLNKSKDAVGAEAARYRVMARDTIKKAASLYERKADISRSKQFTSIAKDLGINVKEFMRRETETKREQQRVQNLISESRELVSDRPLTRAEQVDFRREQEARAILSSPIGSRIYAGLVDVWAQPTIENGELVSRKSTEDINRAIMDYYDVNNMMDVIEILEKQIDLYADPESLERYDAVSLTIAQGLYR